MGETTMAEGYLGQIIGVGFKFAPLGWMVCDGSLLSIAGNEALFGLLGTRYGGDGVSTFAIPDLRGRLPIHQGQGAGLSNHDPGQAGGEENVRLDQANIGHTHSLMASGTPGTVNTPDGMALAVNPSTKVNIYGAGPANTIFDMGALWFAGDGQPHENRQPYLVINFIICVQGVFPSRP
jgi:microcystin-dependent protein